MFGRICFFRFLLNRDAWQCRFNWQHHNSVALAAAETLPQQIQHLFTLFNVKEDSNEQFPVSQPDLPVFKKFCNS